MVGFGEVATTVVVIGAGQAGLSAAWHLKHRGIDAIIIDAHRNPGGAWQERRNSLTVGQLNGIFELPRYQVPDLDQDALVNETVPRYFTGFEKHNGLRVLRPVRALSVQLSESGDEGFLIDTTAGRVRAQWVINATGTWDHPKRTDIPGQATFRGIQRHTRDCRGPENFAGKRVAIVGAGISAVQQLEEISRPEYEAQTFWYTRRPPQWSRHFDGRDTVARVAEDVKAGNQSGSIVSYTGLYEDAPYIAAAHERGALRRRQMFQRITPRGVVGASGAFTELDAIVWATGFRPSLAHLAPSDLVNDRGGYHRGRDRGDRLTTLALDRFRPFAKHRGCQPRGPRRGYFHQTRAGLQKSG